MQRIEYGGNLKLEIGLFAQFEVGNLSLIFCEDFINKLVNEKKNKRKYISYFVMYIYHQRKKLEARLGVAYDFGNV